MLSKDNSLPTATPPPSLPMKRENSELSLLSKDRYKILALAALLLLALWSLFTASLTLKSSAGDLIHSANAFPSAALDDLDILDVIDREKMVKKMWSVYTLAADSKIPLPRFWQQAFEAAYDSLLSDDPGVQEAAFSEIARMSLDSGEFESPSF